MTRMWIYLIVTVGLFAGAAWGAWSVYDAFSERADLRRDVVAARAALQDQRDKTADARVQAARLTQQLATEIKLRETIAAAANTRHQQIMQDLDHALAQLDYVRDHATPDLARCLDTVLPAGAVRLPDAGTPAAAAANRGDSAAPARRPAAPRTSARAARPAHHQPAAQSPGVPSGFAARELLVAGSDNLERRARRYPGAGGVTQG